MNIQVLFWETETYRNYIRQAKNNRNNLIVSFQLVIFIEQTEFISLHIFVTMVIITVIIFAWHLTVCKALSHLQSHLIVIINILDKYLPFQKMTLRLQISSLITGRNQISILLLFIQNLIIFPLSFLSSSLFNIHSWNTVYVPETVVRNNSIHSAKLIQHKENYQCNLSYQQTKQKKQGFVTILEQ